MWLASTGHPDAAREIWKKIKTPNSGVNSFAFQIRCLSMMLSEEIAFNPQRPLEFDQMCDEAFAFFVQYSGRDKLNEHEFSTAINAVLTMGKASDKYAAPAMDLATKTFDKWKSGRDADEIQKSVTAIAAKQAAKPTVSK
jgi:hypothetical protein